MLEKVTGVNLAVREYLNILCGDILMLNLSVFTFYCFIGGRGSVAEWLARWTQVQRGLGSNCSCDAVG